MTTASTRPRLTLVGTVHRDRHGEKKLLSLLERLAPTDITIEMSPAALEYRLRRSGVQIQHLEEILVRLAAETGSDPRALRDMPVVLDIRSLLELPFEYRAAAAFAEARGIPCDLIDSAEVSAAKLKRVDRELITYRNLRILINHPPSDVTVGESCEEGYRSARAMVLERPRSEVRRLFLDRRRGREGVGERDRLMAAEIRRRLEKNPHGHLVHIGGWVHLVEDERRETVYSRLADLGPRRLLLDSSLGSGGARGEVLENGAGAGSGP